MQGTKVIFRDGGTGSAYFLKDGPSTQYNVTWSVDANNTKLSWSMEKVLGQGNTWYPLNFVNNWQLDYRTGGTIRMNLGSASFPVSGDTPFNFTQLQVREYP